jgi:DNA modification methylase
VNVIDQAHGRDWSWFNGDSVEVLPALPSNSVHLSIFSPPFLDLYTYTATERDLGNCRTPQQFWRHFRFIIDELKRITVPGRICAVHVAQVPKLLWKDGVIALRDFRGQTIRAFERRGWHYHGEACIDKDPQAQAIRTHSKSLLFTQLRKDASWMRPALADYLLFFRAPGENPIPIVPDLTNDEWIEWARPIWYGIRESDTLNTAVAKANADGKHICPLQQGTIERGVRLWSNRGETVLSPFGGIASEGYAALLAGRKYIGVELKPEWWRAGVTNLLEAERLAGAPDLFSYAGLSA